MSFDLVSVVVPAYNEEATLAEVYERVALTLDNIGQDFEFVLVDDGSTDGTARIASELHAAHENVTVIHLVRNLGKSIALMQGFDAAEGDVAITLDADLQDLPEMIPRLLETLDQGYDLVGGRRVDRKDIWSRQLLSHLFNWLVSKAFKCQLRDVNCGLKAMRREVYKRLELHGDLHRLVPILALLNGFSITEVPVEHGNRKVGQSRYRLFRHRGLLDVIALLAINSTQTRPFHVFCELSFFFWSLALVTFTAWLGIALSDLAEERLWRLAGTVLGGIGTWAAFVGTILPLFGYFLEVEGVRLQDRRWRRGLVRNILRQRRARSAAGKQQWVTDEPN